MNSYSPDMKQTEVSPEQAGHESEHEMTKTLAGAAGQAAANGAAPSGPGDGATALHTISTGIRSGISPLQFMDSIDAGGQQMGNRAFMHWVGQMHTGTPAGATHGIAAQGLQGPGRPLTHLDTLQQAFGHHDIRGMREHTGAVAGSALDTLDAEGYTRGGHMALAGTPDLYTQAHEAAHGVQQAALGDRLMLPGGIGVAGDRYERQADAVADAVLRGESAQPVLDRMVAGPTQVSATPAGAAAPVQMKRKKNKRRNQPRPEDMAGADDMELEPFNELPDADQFVANPLYDEPANVNTDTQQTAATLDQLHQQMEDLIQELDVPQPAGGFPDRDGGEPGDKADGKLARCLKSLEKSIYPQAQPEGPDDERGSLQRYITYFFPLMVYLYNALTERAGQIQTEEHGVFSLRGILNTLATVMLGLFMVGVALPLDVVGNILGVVARFFVLICDITGKPAEIWLKRSLTQNRQPEEDPARADAPQSRCRRFLTPTMRFLNVFLPQTLITSGAGAYFHASIVQGSLSPSLWILDWTRERLALVCSRIILDNIVFILAFNLGPLLAMQVLVKMLKWGQTLATLFPVILVNVLGVVVDYIAAYCAGPEVTVFQPWHSIRTGVGLGAESDRLEDVPEVGSSSEEEDYLTKGETTAAFFGYAALGMLIQFVSGMLVFYHILARMNAESMAPWLMEFFKIPNRLCRTIAVALASMRNAILIVLSITNIMGLVVSNIIGPLSRDFGSAGFCPWPIAAAGACGGVPDDFDFVSLNTQIELGKEELPQSHLIAIQTFPGIVGALGLGIPIGIVLVQLLLKCLADLKAKRRGADRPDRGGSGATGRGPARGDRGRGFRGMRRAVSEARISLAEEGGMPGSASDIDDGEADEPIYEELYTPMGTLRRQRQRGQRALSLTPQPPEVELEEDPMLAEFRSRTRSLRVTFSKTNAKMSHVRDAVVSQFGDLQLPKEEKDWLLNWARSARNIEQDISSEEIDRAIALRIDPRTLQIVQPGASAREPGGGGSDSVSTHSPQPSVSSHASGMSASIFSPAEQLYDFLTGQFELTEDEMDQHIESWIANDQIDASEAEEIRTRVLNTMLFPRRV